MEKRNFSGKTILKLVGALLALAYLGFCLYAGITGKFPSMHRVEHIMRFGDLKNWVSGGMSAVMIFAFCITSALKDLNLQKGRKESFLPLFLTMILPIILLLLLESYLDIGWIGIALYAGIAAFLFGIAWIPQLLNQWTARRLLRDEPMSGRQQVRIIEWIHFHPLKKLLIFGLWGFGVVLVLRGIWVTATGKIEMDGELFLFLLGTAVLVVALFQKMRRYICTPYRNIPVLNQILSKKQLEQLLDGEHFENSNDGVDRSPGNWFHYCNLNYGLVGTIIERITGQRFDIYMRENVLEPMGLNASYNPGDFDADEIQNVATLYQKQKDGVWNEDGPYVAQIDDYRGVPQDPNKVLITNPDLQSAITLEPLDDYVIGTNGCLFSPQGGLRISPNEMKVLIDMFLNDGKVNGTQIISKESVDAMFTPTFRALPDQSNGNTYGGLMCRYGFGIQEMSGEFEGGDCLLKDRKISLSGHFGEAYGLLAGFFLDRETGTAIYYAMTGQGSEDTQNAGEYSGMYKWEEMFCTALLDNLFPDL